MKFTVDVIIPTYKRSVFLDRAIESVLSQSYECVNVIVVDDNNPEDDFRIATEELMKKYDNTSRVTYLKHSCNKNGAAARNTGIRHSKAEFIAFLDDDDWYKPDKISNQMDQIVGLGHDWGGVCCYHSRRYKNYAYAIYSVNKNNTGNYSYEFLVGNTSTPSSTLLIRAFVFERIGFFDESFERHQDLEFLMRFYRSFKMAISPNYDVCMQIEGFRNYPNSQKAFEIKEKFLNTFREDINAFDETSKIQIFKSQWFEVACLFLTNRDFKKAMMLFKKYIFVNGEFAIVDFVRVLFFLLSGYIPFVKRITAFCLGITIYKKF